MKLKGMGVALITPFKKNEGVDYEALLQLVEFHLQNETDYLVVLGTTGETPTLSTEEQSEIVRVVVSKVQGRIPIVLGVGGNDTKAVVSKLQKDEYSGIDAILSVVPYYSKPTQEGIYQHYKAVAQATKLPVILYNVPSRTGVNMTAETTLRLACDFDNIIAIKEASGSVPQIDEIIRNKPQGFEVISGDDSLTFPLITLGAIGVISVIGNVYPKEFGEMVRIALSGDFEKARKIHHSLANIIQLLFVDGSPAGAKSFLSQKGYIENVVRLPLVSVTSTTAEKIGVALNQF